MLQRNEILLNLQACFKRVLKIPNVLIDDILTYDAKQAPFLVISPTDTQIAAQNSDTWKHVMEVQFQILALNKEMADHLLEEVLKVLEVFQAQKMPKGINSKDVEVNAAPLYSIVLEMDFIFFTPSFRS